MVLRSGKKVIFTFSKGKAKWNYVETVAENAGSYLVSKGLNPGDTVITTGNLNLAHDAGVELKNLR